jgi:hypothetical protein
MGYDEWHFRLWDECAKTVDYYRETSVREWSYRTTCRAPGKGKRRLHKRKYRRQRSGYKG